MGNGDSESSESGESNEDSCMNSGKEDEVALQAKAEEKCDTCGESHYLTKCTKYMGLTTLYCV